MFASRFGNRSGLGVPQRRHNLFFSKSVSPQRRSPRVRKTYHTVGLKFGGTPAYAQVYDCREVNLLYPVSGERERGEREFTYAISGSGAKLRVLDLDLMGRDGATLACLRSFLPNGN